MRFVSISNEVKVSQWSGDDPEICYHPQFIERLPINNISWGKNGTWLMLAQNYGRAEIVSLKEDAKLLHSIQNVKNATCAVFQNLTTRNVALGTSTGQLVLYDIKNKSIKKQFPSQNAPIFKVQCNAKDSHIIAASTDGNVYVYKNNSAIQTTVLNVPKSRTISNFRCHPVKANLLGVCSEEGIVAVWDYNVAKPVAYYPGHKSLVSDLVFKHDNVLSIGLDRRLNIFDYRSQKVIADLHLGRSPSALDLAPDGYSVALGFTDGNIFGYDLRFIKEKENIGILVKHSSKINQIAFDASSSAPAGTDSLTEQIVSDCPNKSESQVAESFSQMYCDDLPMVVEETGGQTADMTDSFMNALALDTDSVNSIPCSITDGVKRLMDSRPNLLSPKIDENNKSVRDVRVNNNKRRSLEVAKAHSTPVHSMHSPIYPVNHDNKDDASGGARTLNEAEIRTIVKETMREEMEEVKSLMKFYIYEVLTSIKQNTLGLQWSIAKLSVHVDENLDQLRNEMFDPDQQPQPF